MQETQAPVNTVTSIDLQIGAEIAYNLAYSFSDYGTECLLSPHMKHWYLGNYAPSREDLVRFTVIGLLLACDAKSFRYIALPFIRMALQIQTECDINTGCKPLSTLKELKIYKAIGQYLLHL